MADPFEKGLDPDIYAAWHANVRAVAERAGAPDHLASAQIVNAGQRLLLQLQRRRDHQRTNEALREIARAIRPPA